MPCSYNKCETPGQWRALLELRPRKTGAVTRAWFRKFAYCDEHKNQLTLAYFLSDEGFTKLIKGLRENGKCMKSSNTPVQRHTTLAWEKLTPEEGASFEPSPSPMPKLENDELPF
jgi:hypothetical protein